MTNDKTDQFYNWILGKGSFPFFQDSPPQINKIEGQLTEKEQANIAKWTKDHPMYPPARPSVYSSVREDDVEL